MFLHVFVFIFLSVENVSCSYEYDVENCNNILRPFFFFYKISIHFFNINPKLIYRNIFVMIKKFDCFVFQQALILFQDDIW